jgi:hypothetical protein
VFEPGEFLGEEVFGNDRDPKGTAGDRLCLPRVPVAEASSVSQLPPDTHVVDLLIQQGIQIHQCLLVHNAADRTTLLAEGVEQRKIRERFIRG